MQKGKNGFQKRKEKMLDERIKNTIYFANLESGEFKITGEIPQQDDVYQFAIEHEIKIDEKIFNLLYQLLTVSNVQQALEKINTFLSKLLNHEVKVSFIENFEKNGEFEITNNGIKLPIMSKNSGSLGNILIDGPFSFQQALGLLAFYDSFVSVVEGLIINHRLSELLKSALDTMFFTLTARARLTEEELKRMEKISLNLSKRLQIDEEKTIIALKSANVGLVGVRDELFEQISKGNTSEEIIKEYLKHVDYGYEIMKEIDLEKEIMEVCLLHHETIDGKGPKGMKGSDIPKLAMVIGISEELVILRKKLSDLFGKYPEEYLKAVSEFPEVTERTLEVSDIPSNSE
ncbi:MAG: HD-GYP domain-containing protein [Fervidobacterium sp.]